MRYLAMHEKMPRGTFDFPIELYYVDASHPRYEMPFHWHIECEFIFILQGSIKMSIGEESFTAQQGDAVFVPSGMIHGGTPKDCVYECIVFDLNRLLQDSTLRLQKYSGMLQDNYCFDTFFKADTPAAQLLDRLFEAMEKEMPGYEFLTTGLIWEFVGTVIQYKMYTRAADDSSKEKHSIPVKNVLRKIRSDYAKPLTLEILAQEAGLSGRYLCRVFRQVTGRTPINYLNYYRIECASELLCVNTESITEIALSCGFSDLGYFARLFRQQKGVSAREWRKLHASFH